MINIVIPYWGEPRYLFAAVKSVQAQSNDDWHLTVVDDCYPDLSVHDYFSDLNDHQVSYIRNDHNLGITVNFQKCLSLASHEYTVFMGSDDLMLPNYVSSVKKIASQIPHIEIIQPGVSVIDTQGQSHALISDRVKGWLRPHAQEPVILSGESLATSLLVGDWLYWPSLAFRTQSLRGKNFDDYGIILDLGLILDLIISGARLAVSSDTSFCYRRHMGSISSASLLDGNRFKEERDFFAKQATRMDELGWHSAARASRLHITSRAHAATLLPQCLHSPSRLTAMLHHILT